MSYFCRSQCSQKFKLLTPQTIDRSIQQQYNPTAPPIPQNTKQPPNLSIISIMLNLCVLCIIMKKGELFRVCLKSSTFQDIPTFRIKIGKTEKKIHPYFIPADKQRYNCDSILERHNQQPELTLSVFFAYKFIGSGSIKFDRPDMPNERLQILNRDKQRLAVIECSLIKINKVVQVPALDITVRSLTIDDLGPKDMTGLPFLVLKYGQLNYQTEKQPVYDSDGEFVFNQSFKFPESEMERVIVQIWCEIQTNKKFIGVCLIYLREKEDINRQLHCQMSYMSKKRGKAVIGIFQDKNKEAKLKDYSHAPKRTLKTTLVEAVMLHPPPKGTYVKLTVDQQHFESTPLFVNTQELRWNQAFTMQVNSEKEELIAQLCVKEEGEQLLGRSFLQISKVGNRTYELTLLDEKETDIGKVYLDFYDHELNLKQRKTISKALADKIGADLDAIKNRYRSAQPLHEYLQTLHAVLSQGLIMVSRKKPPNPLKELGQFLLAYKK